MHRLNLLTATAIAAVVIGASTATCAQTPRAFDIPPGDLAGALNRYAVQADQQILYSGDLVAGLTSPGLRGRYPPTEALNRLLSGSGLSWSETRPGVILLRRTESADLMAAEAVQVEDIIVTGTLLRSAGAQASPVVTLNRDALDRRGLGTVADILTTLPQNYAGSGTPDALLALADGAGSNSAIATSVNLRGLGPDATLTLINGRRLAGSGSRGELADLSALPSAAVERVDVLLDGASALYGADAVAGVVNVIMRRNFDGLETRVRAASAQGGAEDVSASFLLGQSGAEGAALVSYEYQTRNGLSSLDRPYTADGDLRPYGGSDQRSFFSTPGNIVGLDPATRSYVSQWAIRPGSETSARSPGDFAAGQTNLSAQLLGADLIPELERHSVYARGRRAIDDRLEISADLRFSHRAYSFANAPSSALFQVTAANPNFVSPSGAASHIIAYSFYGDLGPTRREGSARSLGVTAGATVDLGRDWSLDGYVAFAEERGGTRTNGRVNSAFLEEALGNRPNNPATDYIATRDGFFNPFGAGSANGDAVLAFIGSGYTEIVDRSRAQSINLLADGPLFPLPGGEVLMALGGQVRRETFATRSEAFISAATPSFLVTPEQERTVAALFGEVRVPLVGPANARPGLQALEISVAGRVEEYDDFGTTSNPKVGVVWAPVTGLALRTSYGTSFRAPALPQLFDTSATVVTTVPRSDGTRALSLYRYGGNPDLKPETATTWTAGIDYTTRTDLRLSLSYFDTVFSDRIAQPINENLNGALTDSALAPFVQLVDPANSASDLALVQSYISAPGFPFANLFPPTAYGAILDARWVNAASVEVRGLDLTAAYPIELGRHQLSFDASASYLFDYVVQTTPTGPSRSLAGVVGYPVRLRSRAGGSWSRDDLVASLHWNHVEAYEDATGSEVEAWDTFDAQLAWTPSAPELSGLRIALSVQNVLDADPPFYNSPTGFGFDPGQGNLLGRVASLQLTQRW